MKLTVCTARITYGGPGRLDITRKGAEEARAKGFINDGEIFAPSKALRSRLYREKLSFEVYGAEYRLELDRAYEHRPYRTIFKSFLEDGLYGDRIVGVCYCPPDAEGQLCCHRTIWRAFMVEKGALDGGELPAEEQRRVPVLRLVKPNPQGSLF